jgi:hypothetical protein
MKDAEEDSQGLSGMVSTFDKDRIYMGFQIL